MAGNTPGSASAEAVVWIASFPKSGTTWVQMVIRQAGRSLGFPDRDLDVYRLMSEGRQPEVIRGVRPEVSRKKTTVLKTHARFVPGREIHPQLGLETAGFIYVMRNPLDMLLSFINYTRMRYERQKDSQKFQKALFLDLLGYERILPYEEWVNTKLENIPRRNLDHALERFAGQTALHGMGMDGTWLSHCAAWRQAHRSLPSVILKYEDLLRSPEAFLPVRKLFPFSREQVLGAVRAVNERTDQYNKIFFNKMTAYYYPQFFSAPAIRRFLDLHARELEALGYGNLSEVAPKSTAEAP